MSAISHDISTQVIDQLFYPGVAMGHHYVPQFYLKGFAIDGAIWAHDKAAKKSFESSIKTVANENNLYTPTVEAFLTNQIETPTVPVLDRLRSGQSIPEEQRRTLAKYVLILWKRAPRRRAQALDKMPELADDTHSRVIARLDAQAVTHPETAAKVAELKAEAAKIIARYKKDPPPEIWCASLAADTGPSAAEESLLSMNWTYLWSDSEQFLTSDYPVFIFEHLGIGKANSELTVPLSSSVALHATRRDILPNRFRIARPAGVREVNRRTAYNSSRFVYSRANESWILPFVTQSRWRLTYLTF